MNPAYGSVTALTRSVEGKKTDISRRIPDAPRTVTGTLPVLLPMTILGSIGVDRSSAVLYLSLMSSGYSSASNSPTPIRDFVGR